MKKLLVILSALVALVLMGARVAGAGVMPESPAEPRIVEESSDGSLRLSSPETWTRTNVRVSDDVLVYGDAWKEAYTKPGTVVLVESHTEYVRDGLFHLKGTIVVDIGIVREGDKIHLVRDMRGETRRYLAPNIPLGILSAACLVVFFLKWFPLPRIQKVPFLPILVGFIGSTLALVCLPPPTRTEAVFFLGALGALVCGVLSAITSPWEMRDFEKSTREGMAYKFSALTALSYVVCMIGSLILFLMG